ncbi:hypothetical protein [Nocardia abscessus]|uniref:hypothetical protein n=2 Tax=Nocardia abscessus TaxID=120957 RepID=UPI0002F489BB|nr:hypothetical protein [Nocardia abscessus]
MNPPDVDSMTIAQRNRLRRTGCARRTATRPIRSFDRIARRLGKPAAIQHVTALLGQQRRLRHAGDL